MADSDTISTVANVTDFVATSDELEAISTSGYIGSNAYIQNQVRPFSHALPVSELYCFTDAPRFLLEYSRDNGPSVDLGQ